MARTVDPIAAYLDAVTDAHHAGVGDADVVALQQIGEAFAAFAEDMAARLNSLSDGRLATRHLKHSTERAPATFEAADIAETMAEAVAGDLDAYSVIRTAMPLGRLASAARISRAA